MHLGWNTSQTYFFSFLLQIGVCSAFILWWHQGDKEPRSFLEIAPPASRVTLVFGGGGGGGGSLFVCFKGKKILMTGDVASGKQLEVLNCGRYECSEVTPGKHKTRNLEHTKNNLPLIISSQAALFHTHKKSPKKRPWEHRQHFSEARPQN